MGMKQKKKCFFASIQSKLVNIYGIARIFQNFDDYPGFQKISGVPILLQHSVAYGRPLGSSVSICLLKINMFTYLDNVILFYNYN